MRRLKFVTLALSGSALLSAGAAHAQFGGIVHDPTAFARQLQELNEARNVGQQNAQQLDEARALSRDLHKMTDIGQVEPNNPEKGKKATQTWHTRCALVTGVQTFARPI